MRDGRAGLGHPPWRGGGGGQAEACLQTGSERPEAGCLGEYWDNGKENGNYYLGFRVWGLGLRVWGVAGFRVILGEWKRKWKRL